MSPDEVPPDERVCANCVSLMWVVGIGQGVRCERPENANAEGTLQHVHPRHTCPLFTPKSK